MTVHSQSSSWRNMKVMIAMLRMLWLRCYVSFGFIINLESSDIIHTNAWRQLCCFRLWNIPYDLFWCYVVNFHPGLLLLRSIRILKINIFLCKSCSAFNVSPLQVPYLLKLCCCPFFFNFCKAKKDSFFNIFCEAFFDALRISSTSLSLSS